MKRFLVVAMVAVAVAGCVARIGDPMGSRTIVFLQRGLIVQVTHTCTDLARVYQAGVGLVAEVRGAAPQEIPMGPALAGDRGIHVTIQSINPEGKVVGVYGEGFWIDHASTTAQAWAITMSGWSGGGRQSRCQR